MKNRITIHEYKDNTHRLPIYVAHKEEERELFEEQHLPGSLFIDVKSDLTGTKDTGYGRNPLPDMHAFAQRMMDKGISADTPLLIYTEGYNIGLFRAWYMLNFVGVKDVVILYAPRSEWMAEDTVKGEEQLPEEKGTGLAFDESRIVNQEELKATKDDMTLIDSRDRARFAGFDSPDPEDRGHIPGAVNYPYQDLLWEDDLDAEKIKAYFKNLDDKPVTVYCGSGMTAGYNALLLDEIGIDAKMYPGSFSDWVSDPDNPVEQA